MPCSSVLGLKKVHLNERRLETFHLFRKLLIPEKTKNHFEVPKTSVTVEDYGMWNKKVKNTSSLKIKRANIGSKIRQKKVKKVLCLRKRSKTDTSVNSGH